MYVKQSERIAKSISDSFRFKNPILIFFKKRTLELKDAVLDCYWVLITSSFQWVPFVPNIELSFIFTADGSKL